MILLTEQDVFLVAPFSLSASLESKDQEHQTHHQHHQAARQGKAYPGACFISGVLQTRNNPVRVAWCLWACCLIVLLSRVHGHEAGKRFALEQDEQPSRACKPMAVVEALLTS